MVDAQVSFSSIPTQDNDALQATMDSTIQNQQDQVLEKSESFFQKETDEPSAGKINIGMIWY